MGAGEYMVLAIVIPLVTAVLIGLSDGKPNQRETITLVGAGSLFVVVLQLLPGVLDGLRTRVDLIEFVPGLSISLEVEPLGMMFALIASFLWIVNSIYSIGYMRGNNEGHQTRFYICFALAIASTMCVALSGNMLTLFIGYEVLSISTYPLVTHHGDAEARKGGRIYLGFLMSTSIGLLLLGMLWTWDIAGTLSFVPGGILEGKADEGLTILLMILYMYGIGKAALMPFHRWLPAAMVAPTPVSALLHAVAVVKAGVFSIVKVVVYIFGVDYLAQVPGTDWLVYVSGFTIIAASIVALRSDNLKRRLAYSTISQLSYVVLATAILAPLSVMGAALHIAAHAFGKITLFFAAGSIYTAAHKTEISQLNGIGRKMPWTMTAFAIGALSMIGVPPTAGFISKWYIVLGALDQEHILALSVIVISTLLNAAYFLPIVYAAFLKKAEDVQGGGHHDHGEAPLPMVIALTITAAGTIILFFVPDIPLGLAGMLVGGGE